MYLTELVASEKEMHVLRRKENISGIVFALECCLFNFNLKSNDSGEMFN